MTQVVKGFCASPKLGHRFRDELGGWLIGAKADLDLIALTTMAGSENYPDSLKMCPARKAA